MKTVSHTTRTKGTVMAEVLKKQTCKKRPFQLLVQYENQLLEVTSGELYALRCIGDFIFLPLNEKGEIYFDKNLISLDVPKSDRYTEEERNRLIALADKPKSFEIIQPKVIFADPVTAEIVGKSVVRKLGRDYHYVYYAYKHWYNKVISKNLFALIEVGSVFYAEVTTNSKWENGIRTLNRIQLPTTARPKLHS